MGPKGQMRDDGDFCHGNCPSEIVHQRSYPGVNAERVRRRKPVFPGYALFHTNQYTPEKCPVLATQRENAKQNIERNEEGICQFSFVENPRKPRDEKEPLRYCLCCRQRRTCFPEMDATDGLVMRDFFIPDVCSRACRTG